jgi:hypothetical protein
MKKQIKIKRTLIYEGDSDAIALSLKHRAVRRILNKPRFKITESFIYSENEVHADFIEKATR